MEAESPLGQLIHAVPVAVDFRPLETDREHVASLADRTAGQPVIAVRTSTPEASESLRHRG